MKYILAIVATTVIGITSWFLYNDGYIHQCNHDNNDDNFPETIEFGEDDSDHQSQEEDQSIQFEYEK